MPNRILKENIRTSCKLNAVSDGAYRFWTYLMTYVDDYGRGSADPDILKGFVYPKQYGKTADDMRALLRELTEAHLITVYTVDGEAYLCFPDWERHQTIRNKRSKFPAPQTCTQLQANVPVIRIQSESESVSEYTHSENADESVCAQPPAQTQPNSAPEAREVCVSQREEENSVMRQFNEICTDLPRVTKLTEKRRRAIRAAQKVVSQYGGWPKLFRHVQQNDFLSGRIGQWAGGSFDWILSPENLQKILEGNYTRRDPSPPASYDIDALERKLLYGPIVYRARQ